MMLAEDVIRLEMAWNLAARRHQGQTYPGTELPYLAHVGEVCMVLWPALEAQPEMDSGLAAICAVLHDTLEDTETTVGELRACFGEAVAAGVLALTKGKMETAEAAMADSLRRIREQPREVWMVKLADRIANLSNPPPGHWRKAKIGRYIEESEMILAELGGVSEMLDSRLGAAIGRWRTFAE